MISSNGYPHKVMPGPAPVRKIILLALLMLGLAPEISAQLVERIEYFTDTDPGYGMGTQVPVTPGQNLTGIVFSLDTSGITPGFHDLFIRSRDDAGRWSLAARRSLYRMQNNGGSVAPVTALEYFIDTDPGFGQATQVVVTPGINLQDVLIPLNVGPLAPGFHQLYIRSKDGNGNWSLCAFRPFFKEDAATTLFPVTRLEYFIDTDPGFGQASQVPVTPGTNLQDVLIPLNVEPLAPGFHQLFIRSSDEQGRWSLCATRSFYKEDTSAALFPVTQVEYFIDNDPGQGLAVQVPVIPGINLAGIVIPLTTDTLSVGFHQLFIRSKNSMGRWSIAALRPFYRMEGIPLPQGTDRVEYFIDNDPGHGMAINVPLTGGSNPQTIHFTADLIGLGRGQHQIFVRSRNSSGNWGLTNITAIQYSGFTISAGGPLEVCPGQLVTLRAPSSPGKSYEWHRNNTPVVGGNDSVYLAGEPGNYYVRVTAAGFLPDTSNSLTVVHKPVQVFPSITGSDTVCPVPPAVVYSAPGGGTGYQWNLLSGGTVVSGGGNSDSTLAILWQSPGTHVLTVNYAGGNGCPSLQPALLTILVNTLQTPTVSGDSACCAGEVLTYSTQPGMTGYSWSIPPGGQVLSGGSISDDSVTVQWFDPGDRLVGVNFTNGCTVTQPALMMTHVGSNPPAAGPVSGPSTVTWGQQGVVYSIPVVTGATGYTWDVPPGVMIVSGPGTNAITVSFPSNFSSGTISVLGFNSCGNGQPSPPLTVSGVAPVPVTINLRNLSPGNGSVLCFNATQAIFVAGNGSTFNVQNGASVTMVSGKRIVFYPGTRAEAGSYLHGYITATGQYCSSLKEEILWYSEDSGNKTIATPLPENGIKLSCFPNPVSDEFTLLLTGLENGKPGKMAVFDMTGYEILSGTITSGTPAEYSLAGQPGGIYLVHVMSEGWVRTLRIVKL